jgi:hypothetical protein
MVLISRDLLTVCIGGALVLRDNWTGAVESDPTN